MVIIRTATDAMKEIIKKSMKVAWVMGITINMQKTKCMEKKTNTKMLKIYDQKYAKVKNVTI
jgi:hypothetical protein